MFLYKNICSKFKSKYATGFKGIKKKNTSDREK